MPRGRGTIRRAIADFALMVSIFAGLYIGLSILT